MRTKCARERIKRALLDLMAEKPFEKVSIKEIAERADVSRATYYHYYYEQREVLEDVVEDLLGVIADTFVDVEKASPEEFRQTTRRGAERIIENREELKTLFSNPSARQLFRDRYHAFCDGYNRELGQVLSLGNDFHEQTFDFIFEGYWALFKDWVMDDCSTPLDEYLRKVNAISERLMAMAGIE